VHRVSAMAESTHEIQEEVLRLKEKENAVILAHNYQVPEIQDVADFIGDSLELSRKAADVKADKIVFCGVDFMAEIAKILNPGKRVLIPDANALCPMAAMLEPGDILKARKEHPNASVLLYVNTSAVCKAEADYACTSANAVQVAKAIPEKEVLFGPDANLCEYVQENVPEKKFYPIPARGFCPPHARIKVPEVLGLKQAHPDAKVIAHPECARGVRQIAHHIESTSGMLRMARDSPVKEFIIATEKGMIYRLQKELPQKTFFEVNTICPRMKLHTIGKVRDALKFGQYEVVVPEEIVERALKSIQRMTSIVVG